MYRKSETPRIGKGLCLCSEIGPKMIDILVID